jgi:hypothetical protein
MFLRDIEIRIDREKMLSMGIKNTDSLTDLFLKKSKKKLNSGNIAKINIYLHNKEVIPKYEIITDVLNFNLNFNFDSFNNSDNIFKKGKCLFDTILVTLVECSQIFNWEEDIIIDTYNSCINNNLVNQWVFKNKLFKSPNSNFFIQVKSIYDLYDYKIYFILYDNQKNQIGQSLIFRDDFLSFDFDYLRWNEDSKSIIYKFKIPKKVFEFNIENIINNVDYPIEKSLSNFFK